MGECSYRIQANLKKKISLPLVGCHIRLLQVSCRARPIKKKLLHKQKIIRRAKATFFKSDEPHIKRNLYNLQKPEVFAAYGGTSNFAPYYFSWEYFRLSSRILMPLFGRRVPI